jgi:hypothetical protein
MRPCRLPASASSSPAVSITSNRRSCSRPAWTAGRGSRPACRRRGPAAPGQPVEERRLADIGTADDREGEGHGRSGPRGSNRRSARPSLARWRVLVGRRVVDDQFEQAQGVLEVLRAQAASPSPRARNGAARWRRRPAARRAGDVGIAAVVDQQKAARSRAMSRMEAGTELSAATESKAAMASPYSPASAITVAARMRASTG